MLGQLKSKLKASTHFPSPPAIAQQIIALARDPHTDISQVAAAIGRDPALAARVLRAANSALYSRQRKSANLRQALIVLGLQGATTLALGFSLIGTYKGLKSNGVDYDHYWRRAILGASAARCFGALANESAAEDIFLAALLQDIAILGVDRVAPDFYRDLPPNAAHREFSAHETARLGIDHAGLGAWLLEYWKLPESLCRAVALSHTPSTADPATPAGMAARCAALGSECVELLLTAASLADFERLAEHAADWLGIDAAALAEVMGSIVAQIPEIERLFDTPLLKVDAANLIVDQARELLMARDGRTLGQASSPCVNPNFAAGAAAPRDERRCDRLTGLFNRGYLDLLLRRELQAATLGDWSLSVVLVDLDRVKSISESHGQEAADAVLLSAANSIASVARDTDCVARYDDSRFVIVLPGLAARGAQIFRQRLIGRLRGTVHLVEGTPVSLTATVGMATHTPENSFSRASHLIDAAERAVILARTAGSDRLPRHTSASPVPTRA